jgi:hypothetical protein
VATPEPAASDRSRLIETCVLVGCVVAFVLVSALVPWHGDTKKLSREGIGIIVAAGLTLIIYSFLYRDNPLFKIAENLYVGVGLGYSFVEAWYESLKAEVIDPFYWAPTREALLTAVGKRFIPILLGILLLTRLSRRISWPSRYTYAILVGWGAGLGIPITIHSFILRQVEPAIRPLGGSVGEVIGALVVLVGTISVLFYFFFSVEHKGGKGAVSRVGIWFLMIAFGASFGCTVMARLSLFIGRAKFLLTDWLGIRL